jgi:hypothetical protein
MEQKYLTSLENAQKSLKIADHLAYVTYPMIKENKLFLQIISELSICTVYAINAVLQYEYYFKRITLFTDTDANLETFREQCVKRYGFTDNEVKILFEIMRLAKAHKNSPMEFVKDKNIVIMSDGMRTDTINIDKIKVMIATIKSVIGKSKTVFMQQRLF